MKFAELISLAKVVSPNKIKQIEVLGNTGGSAVQCRKTVP